MLRVQCAYTLGVTFPPELLDERVHSLDLRVSTLVETCIVQLSALERRGAPKLTKVGGRQREQTRT